ncbi:12782_t:CDS:2, partial [Dentiscutata heterogama]
MSIPIDGSVKDKSKKGKGRVEEVDQSRERVSIDLVTYFKKVALKKEKFIEKIVQAMMEKVIEEIKR